MSKLPYPSAFLEQMQSLLGDEYPAFLEALGGNAAVSLRYNPHKPGASFSDTTAVPWCKGAVYLPERPAFFKDPLIFAGGYYVQEASSMLIAQFVEQDRPLKVLDLCAAPGGKSSLLLAQIPAGSLLVSNEIVSNRAVVLAENVSRWGFANAVVSQNRPSDFLSLRGFFDLVVVDAPCSGEGMFRKDPKVIEHWSPAAVRQCAVRQKEILESAMACLKPGGRLVYSTCTYNQEENEEIVQWMLDREPGAMKILSQEFPADWGLSPGITEGFSEEMRFTAHCYPHKVKGEGFFLSCLRKLGSGGDIGLSSSRPHPKSKKRKSPSGKEMRQSRQKGGYKSERFRGDRPERTQVNLNRKQLQELAVEYLRAPEAFKLVQQEDTVLALPVDLAEDMLLLQEKLRVRKVGIALGKVNGRKFIPDHDLAMSEAFAETIPVWELDYEEAIRYLRREEVKIENPEATGWGVVQYQGLSLGWVKVLEKRVNNHFPKSWRLRADVLGDME